MLSTYVKIEQLLLTINGGAQFAAFKQEIIKRFTGGKLINVDRISEAQQMQIILYLSIINKKHEKIKASLANAEQQLMIPVQKKKAQILVNSKSNEQDMKMYLSTLKKTVHFIETSSQLIQKYPDLAYHTVLAICEKQEPSYLFFKSKLQYSSSDLNKLGIEFNESIEFFDYDKNKKQAKNNLANISKTIYIMKAKEKYFYLYPLEKNLDSSSVSLQSKSTIKESKAAIKESKATIKVIEEGVITTSRIINIFNQQDDSQYPSISSLANSKNSTIIQADTNQNQNLRASEGLRGKTMENERLLSQNSLKDSQTIIGRKSLIEDSMIMATKVTCCKCEKKLSEIDCLYWNYFYYCYHCLIDINLDTSDIPGPRVNKFLRGRNISIWDYEIQCPECQSITKIKDYNPANKNTRYRCTTCLKYICVQHSGNIFSCYCYCPKCNVPTIYLQKLKINFCQKCRVRYCFKCNSKQKNAFCKCVCKYCLGEESKTHECEPACHACNNRPPKLRMCRCGLNICYGCFYGALEMCRQGMPFPCNQSQYA